jgi:hypothetical protein
VAGGWKPVDAARKDHQREGGEREVVQRGDASQVERCPSLHKKLGKEE